MSLYFVVCSGCLQLLDVRSTSYCSATLRARRRSAHSVIACVHSELTCHRRVYLQSSWSSTGRSYTGHPVVHMHTCRPQSDPSAVRVQRAPSRRVIRSLVVLRGAQSRKSCRDRAASCCARARPGRIREPYRAAVAEFTIIDYADYSAAFRGHILSPAEHTACATHLPLNHRCTSGHFPSGGFECSAGAM